MAEVGESQERRRKPSLGLSSLFRRDLPMETETSLFILANMLDFFVTYWLLTVGGFREANPIARWFLDGWGPVKGMLLYKLSLVTTVCIITQIVYTKRPHTARGILVLGSIGVMYVVIYSIRLYLLHGGGEIGLPLDLWDEGSPDLGFNSRMGDSSKHKIA